MVEIRDMIRTRRSCKNYMDLVFVPAPELHWKENAEGVVVLDVVNKGFYNWIAQIFFHRPRVSHIALDAYGTALWLALDGRRDVSAVLAVMEERFPDEKEQMLGRVVSFLRTLQTGRYIREVHGEGVSDG